MVNSAIAHADGQDRMHVVHDEPTGVTGVIALHSTALGPAAGGCRFWRYVSQTEMNRDAVRLARGMNYKNAMAGLPFGGGKAVLHRPDGVFDRKAVFRVFGDAVAALGGAYITAEDVGTTVADMHTVRGRTSFVAGLEREPGMAGGDPSPWTALGVHASMKAAARHALGLDLADATVAIQGVGNVGASLARLLRRDGARLILADVDQRRVAALATELDARVVGIDAIVSAQADIFAPCALGGILNGRSIPALKARLICGGANNQLATEADGALLSRLGVTYAPDYVVNAGGIINVAAEYLGETTAQVDARVRRIPERLLTVLRQAASMGRPANIVADDIAQGIIADAERRAA